jgi:hypothetical protein
MLFDQLKSGLWLIPRLVKQKTSIPVPRVLSWSADATNAIGAEYIIMEELPGVLLQNVWDEMEIADQLRCIQSLGHFCKELCEPRFPAYGSLFLRDGGSLDTIPVDETYCIGPVCMPTQWGHTPECDFVAPVMEGYQGPCEYLYAFLELFIYNSY